MLARLLRRLILGQVIIGAGIGYWVSSSSASPVLDIALWALCLPVLIMVTVDIVSAVLSRGPEPMLMWWRALFGEFHAGIVVFLLRQPWTTQAPALLEATATDQRVPLVLVHGYLCNHRFWDDIAPALRAQGHTVMAVNLEPVYTSIDKYAPIVDAAVQALRSRTGAERVALVGHSMGGLAIRAWMRQHGTSQVAGVLTLGTPHAGTQVPKGFPTPNGQQMDWKSPWLTELAKSESQATRDLIQIALTPQDNICYPQRAQVLEGVTPTVFDGIGHLQMGLDRHVITWVKQRLAAMAP